MCSLIPLRNYSKRNVNLEIGSRKPKLFFIYNLSSSLPPKLSIRINLTRKMARLLIYLRCVSTRICLTFYNFLFMQYAGLQKMLLADYT